MTEKKELIANSMVGRIFAKRHCTKKFIQTVFGRKWWFTAKWEINILKKDNESTYMGFIFENKDVARRVSREEVLHYSGGLS